MYTLLLLIRIFDAVVFTCLAGFLAFVASERTSPPWRRWMASSFAILSLGVSVRTGTYVLTNVPWTWWSSFSLVSAVLACIGFVFAWRGR